MTGLLSQPPTAGLFGIYGLFGFHFFYFVALQMASAVEANLIDSTAGHCW